MQVKAGQRPPIPDSCIPAYRQLIEDCWAQHPGTYTPLCAVTISLIYYYFSLYKYLWLLRV